MFPQLCFRTGTTGVDAKFLFQFTGTNKRYFFFLETTWRHLYQHLLPTFEETDAICWCDLNQVAPQMEVHVMMELNDKNFASVGEHLWSSNQRRQLEADKWDSEGFIIIGKDAWKIAKDSYREWIELIHIYIILDFWATFDRHVYIYICFFLYTLYLYIYIHASFCIGFNLEGMATNQLILKRCSIVVFMFRSTPCFFRGVYVCSELHKVTGVDYIIL